MLELNKLYNMDCMQGMKEFPDGFFDLAIVDPPYGIGIDGQKKRVCGNPKHNRKERSSIGVAGRSFGAGLQSRALLRLGTGGGNNYRISNRRWHT